MIAWLATLSPLELAVVVGLVFSLSAITAAALHVLGDGP